MAKIRRVMSIQVTRKVKIGDSVLQAKEVDAVNHDRVGSNFDGGRRDGGMKMTIVVVFRLQHTLLILSLF
jgi:hypothetical protein